MDIFLGLLTLAITGVFGGVIYFILVPSLKEKSYDELKAEQRKKAEEFMARGRSAKEKAKDKKLKKAGKKVREKTSSETVELSSDEIDGSGTKGHVAFVEPPVVEAEPVSIEEKKKKKNKKKEKPILINKNEITPIVAVLPPVVNHFEQIVPKDDFELKRSISREEIEVKLEAQPSVPKPSKPSKAQANVAKEAKVEKQAAKPVEKPVPAAKQEKPVPAAKQEKPVPAAKQEKPVPAAKQEKPVPVAKPQEKPVEKPAAVPKPVEEVIAKTSTKQSQTVPSVNSSENPSPSIRTSRKKRSELATLQQMSGDKEAVNVSLLMPLVHKAELSWTEIQVLIDVLLNKQQGSVDSAEWIEGRQDPVVKLKKQLAEKEKALTEEQEAGVALQSKLKELRNELNAEKHQVRQLGETVAVRQAELSSLGGRLQLAAEEKQTLVQQIQQLQGKLSEEHQLLCKLQEDQGQTQSVLQQELLAQRQQLEMHITRLTDQHQETMAALEAQMTQMASQLQEQEAMNTSLSGELALMRERGAHLQDSAIQSQDLSRQVKELHAEIDRLVNKSQYDTGRLQTEVNSLTEQLNIKRVDNDKLSSLVQTLQTENNRLTHQISSACVEARQLRDENESLAAQVTASMERPATEGRENGDTSYTESKHLDNSENKVHEKEVLIEKLKDDAVSKDKEVSHIKTDLAQKESLISSLKTDLETAHGNAEKMLKEISSYKCLVQEQESVINALKEEGDSAHKLVNTLREDIAKNKAELTRLSKDCATREQLESKESAIEKLTSELNTHKTKLADQLTQIQALQKQLVNSQDNKSEANTYKTQLAEKEAAVTKYQAELKQLKSQLSTSEEAVTRLGQQVKELTEKQTTLTQELEAQRLRNDDLRSKNWKAMEALSTTEKTLETKMKQSQRLVSEAEEKSRQEEQEKTKQFLQRIFPHISVDNKQRYESWLEEVGKAVASRENTNTSSSGDSTMLAELEKQNCQLQAMVTHYKAIIADTEGMLNRLQSHVEQEETRWTHQLQTLQTQLESVVSERDRLQAGVKNGIRTVDTGSQTLQKRKSFTGWLRHKLRSRSRSRRSRRSRSDSMDRFSA